MIKTCKTCVWAKVTTNVENKEEWPLYCDCKNETKGFSLRAVDIIGCHPCVPTMLVKPEHTCGEWRAKKADDGIEEA